MGRIPKEGWTVVEQRARGGARVVGFDPPEPDRSLAQQFEYEAGERCSPMELYTAVFKLGQGYIQRSDEEPGLYKTNPIIIGQANGRMHRKILFEDTFAETLAEFAEYDWAFVSGCTYWGRANTAENQSKLYAMIFDIDNTTAQHVRNFFSGARGELYPFPNYVVESGHGIHLYYVFDEPIDLYPNIKIQLKELKYYLTRILWNPNTSGLKEVQYQGINQAFRIPGGRTKIEGVRAQAWRFSDLPYTLDEFNLSTSKLPLRVDINQRYRKSKMSLEQAKAKYPEWYERVVLGKQPPGQWVAKPALYEWWLRKITDEDVSYGHRYFCIMALAIYATKCGIYDRDKVKADAMTLMDKMNQAKPDHPFTEADVDSALECLDARYVRFPRKDIDKLTAMNIPPLAKRNGRPQDLHIKVMNSMRKVLYENGQIKMGAPTKKQLVLDWRREHPEGRKIDCERDLGISRPTVLKWWDAGIIPSE